MTPTVSTSGGFKPRRAAPPPAPFTDRELLVRTMLGGFLGVSDKALVVHAYRIVGGSVLSQSARNPHDNEGSI